MRCSLVIAKLKTLKKSQKMSFGDNLRKRIRENSIVQL